MTRPEVERLLAAEWAGRWADFIVVPCRHCGAAVGEPCRTEAGDLYREPHAPRLRDAP